MEQSQLGYNTKPPCFEVDARLPYDGVRRPGAAILIAHSIRPADRAQEVMRSRPNLVPADIACRR